MYPTRLPKTTMRFVRSKTIVFATPSPPTLLFSHKLIVPFSRAKHRHPLLIGPPKTSPSVTEQSLTRLVQCPPILEMPLLAVRLAPQLNKTIPPLLLIQLLTTLRISIGLDLSKLIKTLPVGTSKENGILSPINLRPLRTAPFRLALKKW